MILSPHSRRLARSYWEIGDAIYAHLLENAARAGYGEILKDGLFLNRQLLDADLAAHYE